AARPELLVRALRGHLPRRGVPAARGAFQRAIRAAGRRRASRARAVVAARPDDRAGHARVRRCDARRRRRPALSRRIRRIAHRAGLRLARADRRPAALAHRPHRATHAARGGARRRRHRRRLVGALRGLRRRASAAAVARLARRRRGRRTPPGAEARRRLGRPRGRRRVAVSAGAPVTELRNLPAPAKLNLFLHVTGRRADGYHLLETVFELVDLVDHVDLRLRDDGTIALRDAPAGWNADDDLTVRAARVLAAHTGCRLGVEISLRKSIPVGGGLGGGSSDAATVLLGLNRRWRLGLPRGRLQALALRLGADVPFFVFGHRAFARGVGEALREVDATPSWYVIVAPPVQVPTAMVFGHAELTRNTKPLKISGL